MAKKRQFHKPKPKPKIPADWTEARVYMPKSEFRFCKDAAESRSMSFSEWARGRILGGGEIVVKGPWETAPREKVAGK